MSVWLTGTFDNTASSNSRGVGLSVALQEEANAFLVGPVRVEARHHHDLPRQVAHETGRAEHRLAQPAEALHHEAERGL